MVSVLGYELGWKDAIPFYTATNAAYKGAQGAYDWAKGQFEDATGGGGGSIPPPALNPMNYQYGGSPDAANEALTKAWQTGDYGAQMGADAQATGAYVADRGAQYADARIGDARAYGDRAAVQGNYGLQNQTLGQLGGLEAQQGPSAAQAQLQSGTNQAMAQQMALARSGRGIGGNAAAMGAAQSNMAGITANQANQSAMLRAQEDAAWRQRQAANLGAVAGMQGQQSQADLSAAVASRGQNDAMTNSMIGYGQDAYFRGADARARGYDQAMAGANMSLQGQQLGNQIRQDQLAAWQQGDDNMIRMWAAQNGYNLQQAQARAAENAAILQGAATVGSAYLTGGA